MRDVATWEGGRSPLQLSGWTVTGTELGRTRTGRSLRTFTVLRTAPPQDPPRCMAPGCPAPGYRLDGREPVGKSMRVVDVPALGGAVEWRVRRTRFVCKGCGSKRLEVLPAYVHVGTGLTARAHVYVRHQAASRSFLSIAEELGVSDGLVRTIAGEGHRILTRARQPGRAPPAAPSIPPRFIGIDEIALVDRKDGQPHMKELRTVLVDLESGSLLDLFLDNKKSTIAAWLGALPDADRRHVRGVAIDMSRDYRAVIRAALPGVPVVVDRFHLDRLAQDAADGVRRAEVEGSSKRARSRARQRHNDDDTRMYARLLRARGLPRSPERRRLLHDYLKGHPRTLHAYLARQEFRAVFETSRSREEGVARLAAWEAALPDDIRADFKPVTHALRVFGREIHNFFDLPITNGPTESLNGLMKRIVRAGPSIHIQTLRAKVLARGRLRPATSRFCDRCRQRSTRCEVLHGPTPNGAAGLILCEDCLLGRERKPRRGPPPTLRDLMAGPEIAVATRYLSRRAARRRRGEQLRLDLAAVPALATAAE